MYCAEGEGLSIIAETIINPNRGVTYGQADTGTAGGARGRDTDR